MNGKLFVKGVILQLTLMFSMTAFGVTDAPTKSAESDQDASELVAESASTLQADADISLRRLKSLDWDNEQGASFMERVESIRKKLD